MKDLDVPVSSLGPAMQALTAMQRRAVVAFLETGGREYKRAYQLAGYTGNDNTLRVGAHMLFHNPKVLLAIKEEADRRLKAGAVLGASVMVEIASNPLHKDQFKAASRLLDQAGLGIISESKITHEHTTDKDVIARIERLAKQLGMDPQKLLGSNATAPAAEKPEAIDAEFTEVSDGDNLEDIL